VKYLSNWFSKSASRTGIRPKEPHQYLRTDPEHNQAIPNDHATDHRLPIPNFQPVTGTTSRAARARSTWGKVPGQNSEAFCARLNGTTASSSDRANRWHGRGRLHAASRWAWLAELSRHIAVWKRISLEPRRYRLSGPLVEARIRRPATYSNCAETKAGPSRAFIDGLELARFACRGSPGSEWIVHAWVATGPFMVVTSPAAASRTWASRPIRVPRTRSAQTRLRGLGVRVVGRPRSRGDGSFLEPGRDPGCRATSTSAARAG